MEREPLLPHTVTLPPPVAALVGPARLYDSSGRSDARTLYADCGLYIKLGARGTLAREAQVTDYAHRLGFAPAVAAFVSGDGDCLVTEAADGEDGIAAAHLAEPDRLADVFGESLRALHECDAADCPLDAGAERLAAVGANRAAGGADAWLLSYVGMDPAKQDDAYAYLRANLGRLRGDQFTHGDYCLPNILLRDWRRTALIDWGDGGLGDGHYDLVWGIWTLDYNTGGGRERFLDAYGRDAVDPERLALCGCLAALGY